MMKDLTYPLQSASYNVHGLYGRGTHLHVSSANRCKSSSTAARLLSIDSAMSRFSSAVYINISWTVKMGSRVSARRRRRSGKVSNEDK